MQNKVNINRTKIQENEIQIIISYQIEQKRYIDPLGKFPST